MQRINKPNGEKMDLKKAERVDYHILNEHFLSTYKSIKYFSYVVIIAVRTFNTTHLAFIYFVKRCIVCRKKCPS